MTDLEFELTRIVPCYDYGRVSGGHFNLHFGVEKELFYTLPFSGFLESRLREDDALFEYIKTRHGDKTISHAIWDLYDLGFPVEQWVKDYIHRAKEDVDPRMFNALLSFYKYIKNFGQSSGSF